MITVSEEDRTTAKRIVNDRAADGRDAYTADLALVEVIAKALSTARAEGKAEAFKAATAVAKNPWLKNGLWSNEQDKAAESIQERIAFALECTSKGEDYRNSMAAIRTLPDGE